MLAIIAAKSKNNAIGFENKMPWKQRNDLQRFKSLTYGHTVIMGRKTYASMGGKALPDRSNIVLTTNVIPFCEIYNRPGKGMDCTVMSDLKQACRPFHIHDFPYHMHLETGFIIGGERLFREGMEMANVMYITELDCEVKGDAFFPEIDPSVWKVVAQEKYKADEHNQYDYTFLTYARIPKPETKGKGWNIS
jgi:dihydrofolate reductase